MVTKRRGLLGIIATGLAALLFPGKSAEARLVGASAAFQGLEGTWIDTATSGGQALVLRTFNADGTYTVLATNYPLTSPGQGVWERTGEREFAFTHVQLRYDEQRSWLGTVKVGGTIRSSTLSGLWGPAGACAWNCPRNPVGTALCSVP
jgi:hypothetical protein